MSEIKILDCTLRDGGYINNWHFGRENIENIIDELEDANIDIIECGFIRDVEFDCNTSVFTSMNQLAERIGKKKKNTLYAVMIEYHNHVEDKIPQYDGLSADIIRITFRRREWSEAKSVVSELINKGYKVCVQPVGTVSYDDESLLNLIKEVNVLKPYAFYLVDTLGVMYRHEMRRFFYLIDNNLSRDIALGFHSHNNLQMSFANAQEMIRMARQRDIIVDTSCYGMGRGVGNLATELFADYINSNIGQKYSLLPILNIVDSYLMPIYANQRWGYDLPYFISATVKCHPNYAAFLMKKETLRIEKIEKLLSLIPVSERSEFNRKLIEDLYFNMQSYEVDDSEAFVKLKKRISSRDVLILGPGSSITKNRAAIVSVMSRCYSITTNFVDDLLNADALFISNDKRFADIKLNLIKDVMITSNLKSTHSNLMIFDYASYLGEGDASDNAGAMLIRILKKAGVKKIYLAGFDGFDVDSSANYALSTYKKSMDYDTVKKKNEDIAKQLKLALNGVEYEFITKTKYEI
ncbi:aldolase catalytic domain-containing protein [Mediterraneibacter glycyrrhizinilyticus]|uniref:aldolase catalytic domain-containing protein n=1 Tax=Mediterraneibacter glycyrrhizinilyticus TaxID=342942 RepID=UPI0025A3DF0C|nr:aldolase catalytic domain-containing protein [Mediterraneibacter glycyrrhizinilyticus]MDM8209874.1 aldolase catalytic domain-containing protein [Mediterraneibacter glycyrrhizinilyticus]